MVGRRGTHRSTSSASDGVSSSDQSSHQGIGAVGAGMPIGFLAALGPLLSDQQASSATLY